MCRVSCICAALVPAHLSNIFCILYCMYCLLYVPCPAKVSPLVLGICSGQCAHAHTSFVIQLYQLLLYYFIHSCVRCKCISLAVVSSIVSVSSLIQALSSMFCLVFMVQLIVLLLHVHNQCPITVFKFIINCG